MSNVVVKEKRRPPESERYDELKGKNVVVQLGENPDNALLGVLRWVDRYTLGVYIDAKSGRGKSNQVWIINKSKVVMVGEA